MIRGAGQTHATVVAALALFVALCTGSAWALVGTADIEDDAVLSRHVRNGTVGTADVARDSTARALGGTEVLADSLSGADIDEGTLFNDNSLTGADVKEATLGSVPSAANADSAANASALQGLPASSFVTDRAGFSTEVKRVLATKSVGTTPSAFFFGPLTLRIECNSGPDIAPLASTSVDNTMVRTRWNDASPPDVNYVEDDDLDVGERFDLTPVSSTQVDDSIIGSFFFHNRAANEAVTINFLQEETGGGCIFAGIASRTFVP